MKKMQIVIILFIFGSIPTIMFAQETFDTYSFPSMDWDKVTWTPQYVYPGSDAELVYHFKDRGDHDDIISIVTAGNQEQNIRAESKNGYGHIQTGHWVDKNSTDKTSNGSQGATSGTDYARYGI